MPTSQNTSQPFDDEASFEMNTKIANQWYSQWCNRFESMSKEELIRHIHRLERELSEERAKGYVKPYWDHLPNYPAPKFYCDTNRGTIECSDQHGHSAGQQYDAPVFKQEYMGKFESSDQHGL